MRERVGARRIRAPGAIEWFLKTFLKFESPM
jgi:hypothetical protein